MTPADDTDPNTVRITIKDVYALLLDVKAAVDLTKGHGDQLLDHEKRIRAVERNVWIIVGIGVVAQILVPLIWTQLLP
jgi:hypothetical protein